MTTNPQEPKNPPPARPQNTRGLNPSRAQETAPTLGETGLAPPTRAVNVVLTPGARPLPDFELVAMLGCGGFGEVWRATGPGGIDVALKFVHLGAKSAAVELRSLELMNLATALRLLLSTPVPLRTSINLIGGEYDATRTCKGPLASSPQ
jgi:hypothetical protein